MGRPVGAQQRRAQRGVDPRGVRAQFRRGRERTHRSCEVSRLNERLTQLVVCVRRAGPLGGRFPEQVQGLGDAPAIPEQRAGLQPGFVVRPAFQRLPQQCLSLGPGAADMQQLGEAGAETGPPWRADSPRAFGAGRAPRARASSRRPAARGGGRRIPGQPDPVIGERRAVERLALGRQVAPGAVGLGGDHGLPVE